jgi:hypothetical protein
MVMEAVWITKASKPSSEEVDPPQIRAKQGCFDASLDFNNWTPCRAEQRCRR